jgi:uncharacterized membrane protein
MKKLIEPIFIYFSKIYIFFDQDKGDRWFMLPVVILTTIAIINLEVISFFFMETNTYHIITVFVLLIIFFHFLFRNTNYEYVKNYNLSKKTKVIITTLILVDLVINFVFLNIARNGGSF